MADNTQQPDTSTQDTSSQPFMNFFGGGPATQADQPDEKETLQAMFGPQGDKVPLAHNDTATDMASGLNKVLMPHPVDTPAAQNFSVFFNSKFTPKTIDGRIARNPDGSIQYQEELDSSGKPVKDAQGNPVYEKNTFYVSPARRVLQGILSNALTLGLPAISGHPDVAREVKKEQWNTFQQQALQTAYKNAQTNVQFMRQQQINIRQQISQDFKQKLANQREADFQQNFGFKKDTWRAADTLRQQHQDLQTKEFNNKVLTEKEKALTQAYGPAFDMAQADYMQNHPGSSLEDAINDPGTVVKAHQYYNLLKPQMAYSGAVQKMLLNGEITEDDMGNQARIFKAAQTSPSLKDDEKQSVTAFLQNPMAAQANRLAQIALQNQGRIAMMQTPRPQIGLVPQETGELKPVAVQAGGANVPGNTINLSGASTANTLTPTTRGQVEQAGLVDQSGEHLKQVINYLDQKGKVGNFEGIWKNLFNNSPFADPEIAYLRGAIMSFADLNPKLHNFRGATIGKEFEKTIGGPPKNAQALIGAVQSLMDQARLIGGTTPIGVRTPGQAPTPAAPTNSTTFEFDSKGNLVKVPPKKGK